jgi:hypothetical protein
MLIWNTVDTKLDSLKDLVEGKLSEEAKEEYLKYKELYDLVKHFTIKHHLIMYGGMALNELLPKSKKFYSDSETPDYDCLSYDAKKHALLLGDELKKRGYNYVEVKSGMHDGTYKVFAEFKAAADITQVSKSLYQYLLQQSTTNPKQNQSDPGLIIAPVVFLKWSLYKELSRPEGSLFRWEKIYKRYDIFMKYFKNKSNDSSVRRLRNASQVTVAEDDPRVVDVNRQLANIIKSMKLPLVGSFAAGLYLKTNSLLDMKDCCQLHSRWAKYTIMAEDVKKTFDDIQSLIKFPEGVTMLLKRRGQKGAGYFDELMAARGAIFLKLKGVTQLVRVMTIFDVIGNCYSITQQAGYTVGTVDTLLQYMYAYYMTYDFFEEDRTLSTATLQLIHSLEKYASQDLRIAEQRFSTVCYGKEKTLLNAKKEQWGQRRFVKRF